MSTRAVTDLFEMRGISVTNSVIYRWIEHYSKIAFLYTDSLFQRSVTDIVQMRRGSRFWKRSTIRFSSMMMIMYWITSGLAKNKFKHNAGTLLAGTLLAGTKKYMGKNSQYFVTADCLYA